MMEGRKGNAKDNRKEGGGLHLVIAEKPSVAQSIAKVIGAGGRHDGYLEGNGYVVSWCIGHLVSLAQADAYDEKYSRWKKEDLPILPEKWKYEVSGSTKKQFGVLKTLMNDSRVDGLICATDAGREGELIFRLVYHQARCRKPFRRLWISSMEDAAIREGFENLRPSSVYDALYEAALCRDRADWIVGINASRLFSVQYGQTFNVGRVMSPTLAMVVAREEAIESFVSESFYKVILKNGGWKLASGKMKTREEADTLLAACRGTGKVLITSVEAVAKTEKAPLLFDLTSLQREANRRFGFTAQQTLDYTQSLYEKKLVTYPRTDSRYVTADMEGRILQTAQEAAYQLNPQASPVFHPGQVIDDTRVSDHHAIIPTGQAVKEDDFDVHGLAPGEEKILLLVMERFIAAMGEPAKYLETKVMASCAGAVFFASAKVLQDGGWKSLIPELFGSSGEDGDAADGGSENAEGNERSAQTDAGGYTGTEKRGYEKALNPLSKSQLVAIDNAGVLAGKTKPPARYTENTLLAAMENAGKEKMPDEAERKGIGTSATRAGIIEKLVKKEYLRREGTGKTKYLIPTERGKALTWILPEEIRSPLLTADWEQKLLKIEKGEMKPELFMEDISSMVTDLTRKYDGIPVIRRSFPAGYKSNTRKGYSGRRRSGYGGGR